jgi:hypothetical protein
MATLYIIGVNETGPLKIGWSRAGNATKRRDKLQTGHPYPLCILRQWQLEQARQIEYALKCRLRNHCTLGEWYALSLDDVAKEVAHYVPPPDENGPLPEIEVFRFLDGYFRFYCDFCRTWHQHGGHSLSGHRIAHCAGNGPWPRGYILVGGRLAERWMLKDAKRLSALGR